MHEVFGAVLDGRANDDQIAAWNQLLAVREPNAGPQHEDLFRAYTRDGLTIDLTGAVRIRAHAAVPEAHVGPDGRTWLFFVEGDYDRARATALHRDPWMRTHGLIGFGALDLLIQGADGGWAPQREFVIHALTPGMVVDPTVLPLPEGGWRMYYIAVGVEALLKPDAWVDGAPHTVTTATSTDLMHWTQEGEAVVGPNADPAVWCDGPWCLMISTGLDRSISTDGGRTFTFQGSFGVPGFAPAFLALPDGRLRLFYNTKDRGGALRSMISADRGRTWAREGGDRVSSYTVEAPSFTPAPQGGWWMYYHYWQAGYSPDMFSEGYAASKDAAGKDAAGNAASPPARPAPQ